MLLMCADDVGIVVDIVAAGVVGVPLVVADVFAGVAAGAVAVAAADNDNENVVADGDDVVADVVASDFWRC